MGERVVPATGLTREPTLDTTPQPSSPTRISVTEPVSWALDWTAKVLFKPFDFSKWITLGFCAWLAWLGERTGGGNSNWDVPGGDAQESYEQASDWVAAHIALVAFIATFAALLVLVLWVLFTWLSSRGKLMFLDGVVRDRGAVVEPWHRFREQGNSLFGFRIVLGLIMLVILAVVVGAGVVLFWSFGFDGDNLGLLGIMAATVWIMIVLVVVVAFGLVAMGVNDFVVPIIWLRNCRAMPAWKEFLSLLAPNLGTLVLYVLLKFALSLVLLMLACGAMCLTCCIAAIPYVGTVLLLPLYVFRRSYSMYFLSQFGPDYAPLGPAQVRPGTPPGDAAPGSEPPPTP